jgi:hypothetical protein
MISPVLLVLPALPVLLAKAICCELSAMSSKPFTVYHSPFTRQLDNLNDPNDPNDLNVLNDFNDPMANNHQ